MSLIMTIVCDPFLSFHIEKVPALQVFLVHSSGSGRDNPYVNNTIHRPICSGNFQILPL